MLHSPAFFSTPSCPFYDSTQFPGHYNLGDASPYGEEAKLFLDFLVSNHGKFTNGNDFAQYTLEWAKGYTGRKNGWLKEFEKNMTQLTENGETNVYPSCGADDAEAILSPKVVFLAAICYGSDSKTDYLNKVEEAVRTHQNNQLALDVALSFGKILWRAMEGGSLEESIQAGKDDSPQHIIDAIDQACTYRKFDTSQDLIEHYTDLCKEYGSTATLPPGLPPHLAPIMLKACGLPQSFTVSLKLILDAESANDSSESDDDTFTRSVEQNIVFGGDCCGRNAFIVGIQSALGKELPRAWYEKTRLMDEVETQCRVFRGKTP